ncbi:MAG: nuclear transport factor 2 family protein [Cohaesibacteraceae bacterium]
MAELPHAVEAYIAAYNAMDVDGMVAMLTDDVVFKNYSGSDLTAEANGKAAFEELARIGVGVFRERKQTVVKAVTKEDTTVATIRYKAVVAVDLPNGWKAGEVLDFQGSSEFQLRDGKIAHITDQS